MFTAARYKIWDFCAVKKNIHIISIMWAFAGDGNANFGEPVSHCQDLGKIPVNISKNRVQKTGPMKSNFFIGLFVFLWAIIFMGNFVEWVANI